MKPYGLNELRKMFLDYFESKDHLIQKSFSLVPQNDKSLLLIGAGMAPLKPYFTGQENPPKKRMATCQKCIRTPDIENVGKTSRHGTFFEMLGNFSFGDYFKKEAIAWSWEFLTVTCEIPEDSLYPSVYEEDDEAFEIWTKDMKIAKERIFRFGKEDNFWEHGSGPCGPCSEIYFDRGEKYGCGSPECTVGCECDRYIEIWNNVFTQFNSDGKGNYVELENKNIDTGMGLERLAVVMQGVDSLFEVDTIRLILDKICELSGKKYHENEKNDISIRIIADHIRSVTFMLSDGVIPSNEGRGYVLRRLIRRAARYGRLLGIKGLFLTKVCDVVIQQSGEGYPELNDKKDSIKKFLTIEEENFNKTIDQGLAILKESMSQLDHSGKTILSGEDAFKLYDTYGFPLDLTKEILEEKGYTVDEKIFKKSMNIQRDTARAARKQTNYMGTDVTVYQTIDANISSKFVGYHQSMFDSVITVMTTANEIVNTLKEGEEGTIIVEETPYYATMGGQSADTGIIKSSQGMFSVMDTISIGGSKIGHVGKILSGVFKIGDHVTLSVDNHKRDLTCKNHSATHLLQKALRIVLGSHVEQSGSFVNQDKLRFDFTHFSPLTTEEIKKVEDIVNEKIRQQILVATSEMSQEEARKAGAMALFGEKYGNIVRVVQMGDFSSELCGGTHVTNTGVIGTFKIISETGIAAGVRRIEAFTGQAVMNYYYGLEATLQEVSNILKADQGVLVKKAMGLMEQLKNANREVEQCKAKLAQEAASDITSDAKEINGIHVLVKQLNNMDIDEMSNLGDIAKNKLGESVILLGGVLNGKVSLLAMATEGAIAKGAHAGNLMKEISAIVGGGGGGRPNMARAGGKKPEELEKALSRAMEIILEQIS